MTSDGTAVSSPRSLVPTIYLGAIVLLFFSTVLFAFLYVVTSRDLDEKKTALTTLKTELAVSKSETAKEAARVAELKSDLNLTQTVAQSLAEKSTQLQSEVELKEKALAQEKLIGESTQAALEREKSRPPIVPVRIEMRRSVMGRGLVAVLTNTSARQLPLLLSAQNPTTQTTKQLSLQIPPGGVIAVGHQEGWQFASGDRVLLHSADFEDLTYVVP